MIFMNAIRREAWVNVVPGHFNKEHFDKVMESFDGRSADAPSMLELARVAGVSRTVLKVNYRSARSFEKLQAIVSAAAYLLQIDERALAGWVFGEDQPKVQERIEWLGLPKCSLCSEPGQPDGPNWIAKLAVHKNCFRESQAPHLVQWAENVTAMIHVAPLWLQRAWSKARKGHQPITYVRLAELAHKDLAIIREAWARVQLPERSTRGDEETASNLANEFSPTRDTRPGRSSR